jgi:putative flippase GtrA
MTFQGLLRYNIKGMGPGVVPQVVRYGLAGLIITILFSAAYWAVAELGGVDPMISLAIVFVVFSGVGYVAHGTFSFRGYGERDRQHVRAVRFFLVNLVGFALNQFFVWLLVKQLGGPTWWPIVPFMAVTPWVTFALHRKWVYA